MKETKKWIYPAEDNYGIGIGKTENIVGEILVAVVVWNKKIRLYERRTYSSPYALNWLPKDEDWANQWKEKLFKESEKCRKKSYSLAGIELPIEIPSGSRSSYQMDKYQGIEAALLENLVVILGQEPITDWMALCKKVTSEQFEEAMKEFETEWNVFSFEDWGK